MIKIVKKIKFSKNEDRMKDFGNIKKTIKIGVASLKKQQYLLVKEKIKIYTMYSKRGSNG